MNATLLPVDIRAAVAAIALPVLIACSSARPAPAARPVDRPPPGPPPLGEAGSLEKLKQAFPDDDWWVDAAVTAELTGDDRQELVIPGKDAMEGHLGIVGVDGDGRVRVWRTSLGSTPERAENARRHGVSCSDCDVDDLSQMLWNQRMCVDKHVATIRSDAMPIEKWGCGGKGAPDVCMVLRRLRNAQVNTGRSWIDVDNATCRHWHVAWDDNANDFFSWPD